MRISRLLYAAALSLMVSGTAGAKHLSPEQALSAVSKLQTKAPAQLASRTLSLVHTLDDSEGLSSVYIFGHKTGAPGFVVLAADDAVGNILLGYSETARFDAENIPASVNWWLERYSYAVEECAQNPDLALKPASRATDAPVDPICQTLWNQGTPFNNMCPLVPGGRCVTGCVATAMAQVMKAHEWPVTGTGSNSYQFAVNNVDYTASSDFSAVTFDWANMLDNYNGAYSQANADAVAALMYNCGVASNMQYSPDESGTADIYAGQGFIEYFNYDPALAYSEECWFTPEDWHARIYNDLAAGRPVMLGGQNSAGEGHEFVCDGYDGNDYFHINWGWGGMCDGYFLLSALDPPALGTGGGSGSSGFNYNVSALTGIQPPVSGSETVPCMAFGESFTVDKTTYDRSAGENISFDFGAYSFALQPLTYCLAMTMTSDDNVNVINLGTATFGTLQGFVHFDCPSNYLPVGEYTVSLAYKTDAGWEPFYYDLANITPSLYFKVTKDTVKVSAKKDESTTGIDAIISDSEAPVYYNMQGVRVEHPRGTVIKVEGGKATKTIVR